MFERYSNNIKSFWVIVGFMLGAVLLSIIAFYMVKSVSQDFNQKNAQLMMLTTKRASLSQMKKNQDEIIANKQRIEAGFVGQDKIVDFIVVLENLAQNTGNSADVKAVEGASKTNNNYLNFKVQLAGSYSGLTSFLAQLENFNYFTSIAGLDITSSYDPAQKTSVLRANLDIRALAI